MRSYIKYALASLLAVLIWVCSCTAWANNGLNGAGSSFIYPLMAQWTDNYHHLTGVEINYQPIGSGGGISQLHNKTIDFAASDVPQSLSALHKNQWQQFPAAMGAIVLAIHLQGVPNNQLVLSGPVIAAIYQGKIQYWNDPALLKLNPHANLPKQRIIAITRSDGSGTTYNFTHYLSQVAPSWGRHNFSTIISWPANVLGAKGNAGVASQVKMMPGSIGYVEYAYAKQSNMTLVRLQNSSGKVVSANSVAFGAAVANANWPAVAHKGFNLLLTNQPGAASWPIMATTYILVPQAAASQKASVAKHKKIIKFFNWALSSKAARTATFGLDYIPAPAKLVHLVQIELGLASGSK